MSRRGSSLGAVLAIISVGLLAAFTMAASSSLNLQVAQRVENSQQASLLAESAVQTAMAHLMENGAWEGDVTIPGGGRLTFNRTLGLAYSTNNHNGTHPAGWLPSRLLPAGVVPGERVHLVGVGTCRNVTRTVECLVSVPNFTVSIASNGKVHLRNSVVAALKNPADADQVPTHPELLGPGDLATNDSSASAIVLDDHSEVTGNVQAAGTVKLNNGSKVGGEVRFPWAPAEIPLFPLAEYDPASTGALNFRTVSGVVGAQTCVGLVRASGDLTVVGDLTLDNALLYVDGNLNVSGGLKGAGAVLVTQSATVRGGANLSTDDEVALLCNGDVNLLGDSSSVYDFHGLIYTRGNFTATNFQVVGAFIANGASAGMGNVNITGCRMYSTPVNAQVPIYYPRQVVIQIAGSNPPDPGNVTMTDKNLVKWGNYPDTDSTNWRTPALALAHRNGQPWNDDHADVGPWHWYDVVVLEIRKEDDKFVYEVRYDGDNPLPSAAQYPERFTTEAALYARLADISAVMCPDFSDGRDADDNPSATETREHRISTYYPGLLGEFGEGPAAGQPISPNFSFDPNRFLKTQDKIRIAARLEY